MVKVLMFEYVVTAEEVMLGRSASAFGSFIALLAMAGRREN